MKRIGILGSGEVGQTLANGFKKHGYDVRIASRSPGKLAKFTGSSGIANGTFQDVAAWAEMLVLCVLGSAAKEVLDSAGAAALDGKVIIDTTNPIDDAPPEDGVIRVFTGPNESLLERLQAAYPRARFVKAFNSVGNDLMVNPTLPDGKPTMFFCGNDAEAKAEVAKVLDQFGWDPADMGTMKAARAIEPLCQLWCIPGFLKNDWSHAFKMLRA
jgi:8-hydroxy-5-deazaflavin:NADPH oxidoreductase